MHGACAPLTLALQQWALTSPGQLADPAYCCRRLLVCYIPRFVGLTRPGQGSLSRLAQTFAQGQCHWAGGGSSPTMRCNTASGHRYSEGSSGVSLSRPGRKKKQWGENLTYLCWRLMKSALRPTVCWCHCWRPESATSAGPPATVKCDTHHMADSQVRIAFNTTAPIQAVLGLAPVCVTGSQLHC